MLKKTDLPFLVVSDDNGNMFEIPELRMAVVHSHEPAPAQVRDMIPLPIGSDLFRLPDRHALGWDPLLKKVVKITRYQGVRVWAAAAFMSPAYVQLGRAAYATRKGAVRLPLYSYTAVGWKNDNFCVPACRIDADTRQDLDKINCDAIEAGAVTMLGRFSKNRLVEHLVNNCVRTYGCPAARNFVLERWEAPIPTSRACNARCLGCISDQPCDAKVTASHNRIAFIPTADEIAEYCIPHLQNAPRPVVSFGQGCEGEPLTNGNLLIDAVTAIRKKTKKGIINVNTNGSKPDVIEKLCAAGLDSIRVSMNSAQPELYTKYYRPQGYSFTDTLESLSVMRKYKRWSSINYFIFPGLTDHPDEIGALKKCMKEREINMIQTRNLNMDPEWYVHEMGIGQMSPDQMRMTKWLSIMQTEFPRVKLGYFNPPREEMEAYLTV